MSVFQRDMQVTLAIKLSSFAAIIDLFGEFFLRRLVF
jgi:hypothetical protein